MSLLIWT